MNTSSTPTDQTGSVSTPPESHMVAIPEGGRVIISVQGDWWDTLAMRAYGFKRGNEHLMYRLIEANYYLRNVSHFPAGVPVIVPAIDVAATEIVLVPWKSALQIQDFGGGA